MKLGFYDKLTIGIAAVVIVGIFSVAGYFLLEAIK